MGEQLELHFGQGVAVLPQPGGAILLKPVPARLSLEGGTREAAKILRIPQRTVQDMVRRGEIPGVKLREGKGKNIKYRVDMVAVYQLAERKHAEMCASRTR